MSSDKKVLIAEDDEGISELMEEALNKTYDIVRVDNGFSAVTKAKEEIPGLIILDLFLPRMDGINVCKKLKANPLTKNIPILVVSAYNKKELIVALLRLGVKNFLAKPFEIDNLVKRVNELYTPLTASSELANLKVKYAPASDLLNIKITGNLTSADSPVLINDIEGQLTDKIKKIILNVNRLDSFGTDQVDIIEKMKDHFQDNEINFKISTGGSSNLKTNLLKNSRLRENLQVY